MSVEVYLDELYKIDIEFSEVYIIDEKIRNFNKKVLVNTSTRLFNNVKYDTLYIIEPRVAYLIPLPSSISFNNTTIQNLIGETGIILQLTNNYILMYNTNENLVFLNKGVSICKLINIINNEE